MMTPKNMMRLLVVVLAIIAICMTCACIYYKNRSKCLINIELSDEGIQVVFDLVFCAFQNTDFDKFIGTKLGPMSDADVIDRRQYREGYVSTMKRLILSIPTDNHIDRLRYQAADFEKCNSIAHVTTVEDFEPIRKSSRYYAIGSRMAYEEVSRFENPLLWNEITKTKFKYYETDWENYFKHGKALPDDVLKQRIEEIPRLQAIIFLQNTLDLLHNLSHAFSALSMAQTSLVLNRCLRLRLR